MAEENSKSCVSSEWDISCNNVCAPLGVKADNLAVKNLAQTPAQNKAVDYQDVTSLVLGRYLKKTVPY